MYSAKGHGDGNGWTDSFNLLRYGKLAGLWLNAVEGQAGAHLVAREHEIADTAQPDAIITDGFLEDIESLLLPPRLLRSLSNYTSYLHPPVRYCPTDRSSSPDDLSLANSILKHTFQRQLLPARIKGANALRSGVRNPEEQWDQLIPRKDVDKHKDTRVYCSTQCDGCSVTVKYSVFESTTIDLRFSG
ncbi:hypothetical protein DFH29DRAFT_1065750 [Suillus ampliporus]|nr:hypothetical protein DFH29DRAFT_1065750 [Suillus ampliporus]